MTTPVNQRKRNLAVAVLVVAVGVVLLLVVAGGMLVLRVLTDNDKDQPVAAGPTVPAAVPSAAAVPAPATGSVREQQDALAAEPMFKLPPSAVEPQPLVAETAGPTIVLPKAAQTVVVGGPPVATGFPQTPEGALAQLAAIEETALSSTDLQRIEEIYRWAALPEAVELRQWHPYSGISTLLEHVGDSGAGRTVSATYQVVQGQIKGQVGSDFVVACVLGEYTATLTVTKRGGYGDCQRMSWDNGRWWIGAGSQPAQAPMAWPGSADAVRAGWRVVSRG
jgi:hypothetical protein